MCLDEHPVLQVSLNVVEANYADISGLTAVIVLVVALVVLVIHDINALKTSRSRLINNVRIIFKK